MPRYDFACTNGHTTEHIYTVAELPKLVQCKCGAGAEQLISAPALHLLSSFSRDIDDADVRATRNPADGSYLDPTLSYHPETGKVVAPITSEKQRRQLMEARGLFEKPPSDKAKDVARLKRTRPVHVLT